MGIHIHSRNKYETVHFIFQKNVHVLLLRNGTCEVIKWQCWMIDLTFFANLPDVSNLHFAAEDKHYVKVTGTAHGWYVLFYIFQSMRVVLLFTVCFDWYWVVVLEALFAREGKECVADCSSA
ncbi:uncharacterized protein LOC132038958 [Lycium ferocissimum]|uniref:uncharacterized protein LOC132038958 n=1 Tax=Lycium ferocissimum TaxID=112874 RepID=UPI0028166C12|nr:uncharacterized protein LOC132038958 [Lycium ferocissimum]